MLTVLKGLPLAYNKDFQEDKECLFDSIDTISLALEVFTEMISGMDVNRPKTLAAASDPMLLATDLADYLVNHGVPFRQAHEVIGKLVAYSIEQKRGFGEMTLEEFQQFSPAFEADVTACLNLETALAARKGIGAPSPQNVKAQLARWRTALNA
jgi:argininosuccinate lyase